MAICSTQFKHYVTPGLRLFLPVRIIEIDNPEQGLHNIFNLLMFCTDCALSCMTTSARLSGQ